MLNTWELKSLNFMKKIFLNYHSTVISGIAHYLENYLLKNNHRVISISHPLDNYEGRVTLVKEGATVIKEIKRKNIGILNLFYDFYLSLKFLLKNDTDVFIGANNFDTMTGVVARNIFKKKIDRVVYFASDYSEDRFGNVVMAQIYSHVEKYVLKNSDLVVSNTRRAEEKRISFGLDEKKSMVIPNGIHLDKEIFEDKQVDKGNFIYVGSVTKEHGLYDLIEILHPIIKKFILIGFGDDWDRVVGRCKEKKFDFESFYKKDHEFTIDYLQKFNGIGLAPYNMESKWTYYCSPLKVGEYISCGVPVLMSDVPEIANLVKKEGYGVIYSKLDYEIIKGELEGFDTKGYYNRAKKFYSEFKHEILFGKLGL